MTLMKQRGDEEKWVRWRLLHLKTTATHWLRTNLLLAFEPKAYSRVLGSIAFSSWFNHRPMMEGLLEYTCLHQRLFVADVDDETTERRRVTPSPGLSTI